MKGQIESKNEREFSQQQKLLKELKKGGMTVEKAEKKTLQSLGALTLMEKPREYRITFPFPSPGEHGLAIDVLDATFEYSSRAPIFSNVRFQVNIQSRVVIVMGWGNQPY